MPITLAYVAASLEKERINFKLIDSFGEKPVITKKDKNFLYFGKTDEEIIEDIDNTKEKRIIVGIFANQLLNHNSIVQIIKKIKKNFLNCKIIILENTQAVTAYSLRKTKKEFLNLGVDYLIVGEPEVNFANLIKLIKKSDFETIKEIKGVISNEFENNELEIINNIDDLAFPAWHLFNLKNYWKMNYAHGPLSKNKYLPMLTSRGCPYPCKFCVVPFTNNRKWRARSSENIISELKFFKNKYSVLEFHFEDLNFTVNDRRTKDFCKKLISSNLNISWKLVAGTKVESMKDEETIKLMAESGCKYISISPESGSKEVMKLIEKPFNLDHAIKMVHLMNKYGIKSQACFVLGYPGEKNIDLKDTRKMIFKLTKNGIDEIALFIISPVPGSAIYSELKGYSNLSELNFSPTWRKDYKKLFYYRLFFYFYFLFFKSIFYPNKIIKQVINFFTKNFETKMEMVPYKNLEIRKHEREFKK